MKLRIILGSEQTCCFQYWGGKAMRACGHKALVIAGRNQYLCREHASYASQFAKEFLSERGREMSSKDFFSLLEVKYKELKSE